MKLIAELLSKRMENKMERRIREEEEKNKNMVERRLTSIKRQYDREMNFKEASVSLLFMTM